MTHHVKPGTILEADGFDDIVLAPIAL